MEFNSLIYPLPRDLILTLPWLRGQHCFLGWISFWNGKPNWQHLVVPVVLSEESHHFSWSHCCPHWKIIWTQSLSHGLNIALTSLLLLLLLGTTNLYGNFRVFPLALNKVNTESILTAVFDSIIQELTTRSITNHHAVPTTIKNWSKEYTWRGWKFLSIFHQKVNAVRFCCIILAKREYCLKVLWSRYKSTYQIMVLSKTILVGFSFNKFDKKWSRGPLLEKNLGKTSGWF